MVDEGTRRDPLEADDELDEADEEREPRTVVVNLNPVLARISWGRLAAIAAILGGAVIVGFVIYAFIALEPGRSGPSKGLEGVVLLVAGFVTVGILLYLGTLIHRALDMGTPAEALGMPEGSIRALIAMSLILIFAIIGILVFNQGSAGSEAQSTGLTQAQIDALRADGAIIVSQSLQEPAPPSPAAALYDVTTRATMTREAHDFGLQLMTTVSTLVVAVAGFYFGSRSVAQASTAIQEQLRLARSFSARRPEVVGARPEPEAAGTEEAPADDLADELGPDGDEAEAEAAAAAPAEGEPEGAAEAEGVAEIEGEGEGDGEPEVDGDEAPVGRGEAPTGDEDDQEAPGEETPETTEPEAGPDDRPPGTPGNP